MKCEEFEAAGLGLDRESAAKGDLRGDRRGIDLIEFAAALEHVNTCARCAALQESWQEAQLELRALREATQNVGAPLRVEMRLRQEFWAKRRAMKARTVAVVTSWILATATLLVMGTVWWNWHIAQENIPLQSASVPEKNNQAAKPSLGANPGLGANQSPAASTGGETPAGVPSIGQSDATLVAARYAEDFTLLPGSMPQETGDGAVVRVRLQRGALGALGLPVNEERAGDWIQVDLLVGQDGQPQAVRLPR
jgi:hypothetical protein